ncbi:aminotransferase class IV [Limisphaera sp. VF-2]|uniref:aminotransferase class IV n=1 Tax=Limisphaera sp. VF-2 TaxID=3400418 RepID=UPI003C1CEA65
MMMVYWNGRIVPAEQACVSVMDRGFLFGDGVFETVRLTGGRPFLWKEHWARWQAGASFLGIQIPVSEESLRAGILALVEANQIEEGVLRLTLSRGPGPRGYSPRGAGPPTLVMTVHPIPPGAEARATWRVCTSRVRLAGADPLSRFKTCNRLLQVLARAEADAAGLDEAILLDSHGCVIEGSSCNVFWVKSDRLVTPGPEQGALPGVTRGWVMAEARARGWEVVEATAPAEEVWEADGVFVTLSTRGIVEVTEWDGRPLRRWPGVAELWGLYEKALQAVQRAEAW